MPKPPWISKRQSRKTPTPLKPIKVWGKALLKQGDNAGADQAFHKAKSLLNHDQFDENSQASIAVPSAPTPETRDDGGCFELGFNGGLAVAGNPGLANQYATGGGGGFSFFFPVNQNFSMGLMGGIYGLSQGVSVNETGTPFGTIMENSNVSTQAFEIMLAAKYYFSTKGVKPFALIDFGLADTSTSGSEVASSSGTAPATETVSFPEAVCPALAMGFGLDFQTGTNSNIFIQGKESIILMPANQLTYTNPSGVETVTVGGAIPYSTFEIGLSFDFKAGSPSSSPTTEIPVTVPTPLPKRPGF